MNKRSILILTNEFPDDKGSPGGVGSYIYDLAKAFCHHNIAVSVIAPGTLGCKDFDKKLPFKIKRTTNKLLLREAIFLFLVIKYSLAKRSEVVFCSTWLPSGLIGYLMNKINKKPYVIAAHGSEIFDKQNSGSFLKESVRRCLRVFKRHVYNNSMHIFSISSYTKKVLIGEGVDLRKISIVNNGVDVDKFKPLDVSQEFREKHGLCGHKVLLTVSRLDLHKGHDIVIRALPSVIKKIKNLKYLIIGVGSEEPNLKTLVNDLGLDDHVVFLGYVNDQELISFYNVCDLFIMLSREIAGDFEGFGLVYLEANACGKPVIGARTGGIEDAITNGRTGLLIDDFDIKNVSDAILKLIENEDLACKLGKAGYEEVKKNRTWKHVSKRMLDLMRTGVD